ncbi:MAG: helix-turn-helix domain-containing protein [Treponema sp.]|jgi:AraC-like DNA-binding protein|nr:helix-turn-helix domain-containing protein [Treponema sp.]
MGGGTAKTPQLLRKAWKLLRAYGEATETMACVIDHNFTPIPESIADLNSDRNICLCCAKFYAGEEPGKPDVLNFPCCMFHINAMKEAYRFKGSSIYMCDRGFMFWTSPVFSNGQFSGALVGSGCLGIDAIETAQVPQATGMEQTTAYPRCDPERVKALAELLLMCAESLSVGDESYHKTLKRRAEQQARITEQIALLKERYSDGSMPGYPLDKEQMLLDALRRGEGETGKKLLDELLGVLFFSNQDKFKYIKYRAIELAVLISRTAVTIGHTGNAAMETIRQNLSRIREVRNIEELTDALHSIAETTAEQVFSFQGFRHAGALRKAERFIWENYTRRISLREIADEAGLSAPYFSTIFKEEMGENLSCYLNRLRVGRAGRMLLETDLNLSEIAGSCGFEDQSWFSKIFKSYTGMSPGKFRARGGGVFSEISALNFSKNYQNTVEGKDGEPAPKLQLETGSASRVS